MTRRWSRQVTDRTYYVYIMTSINRTVLYTGVTNNLPRRVHQHKSRMLRGFTSRYHVTILVYFESFPDVTTAIAREKQIKAGSRQKKIALIDGMNPTWKDLYYDL